MAKTVTVNLIDDIDGSCADETVTFSFDGVSYEIDLGCHNAIKLRSELNAWAQAGRPAEATVGRSVRSNSSAPTRIRPQPTSSATGGAATDTSFPNAGGSRSISSTHSKLRTATRSLRPAKPEQHAAARPRATPKAWAAALTCPSFRRRLSVEARLRKDTAANT